MALVIEYTQQMFGARGSKCMNYSFQTFVPFYGPTSEETAQLVLFLCFKSVRDPECFNERAVV